MNSSSEASLTALGSEDKTTSSSTSGNANNAPNDRLKRAAELEELRKKQLYKSWQESQAENYNSTAQQPVTMDSWFMQQRAQSVETRKKKQHATEILRNYRPAADTIKHHGQSVTSITEEMRRKEHEATNLLHSYRGTAEAVLSHQSATTASKWKARARTQAEAEIVPDAVAATATYKASETVCHVGDAEKRNSIDFGGYKFMGSEKVSHEPPMISQPDANIENLGNLQTTREGLSNLPTINMSETDQNNQPAATTTGSGNTDTADMRVMVHSPFEILSNDENVVSESYQDIATYEHPEAVKLDEKDVPSAEGVASSSDWVVVSEEEQEAEKTVDMDKLSKKEQSIYDVGSNKELASSKLNEMKEDGVEGIEHEYGNEKVSLTAKKSLVKDENTQEEIIINNDNLETEQIPKEVNRAETETSGDKNSHSVNETGVISSNRPQEEIPRIEEVLNKSSTLGMDTNPFDSTEILDNGPDAAAGQNAKEFSNPFDMFTKPNALQNQVPNEETQVLTVTPQVSNHYDGDLQESNCADGKNEGELNENNLKASSLSLVKTEETTSAEKKWSSSESKMPLSIHIDTYGQGDSTMDPPIKPNPENIFNQWIESKITFSFGLLTSMENMPRVQQEDKNGPNLVKHILSKIGEIVSRQCMNDSSLEVSKDMNNHDLYSAFSISIKTDVYYRARPNVIRSIVKGAISLNVLNGNNIEALQHAEDVIRKSLVIAIKNGELNAK